MIPGLAASSRSIEWALVQGVIFDLDDTLLLSEQLYADAFAEALHGQSLPTPGDVLSGLAGLSEDAVVELLSRRLPGLDRSRFRSDYDRLLTESRPHSPVHRDGSVELLDRLGDRALPLAVATSARRHHALQHLEAAGLLPRFAAVLTADDVDHPKPSPDLYIAAARAIDRSPAHCLAVEDSITGVRAARSAGCQVAYVPLANGEDALSIDHPNCATFNSLNDVAEALLGSR
ncbi:MAG: HAD family phosphatase [Pseudorhodoplanes sp.]|nr:HAD family phosphatase [Pseudorhodoplanes sp.]